jgi:tripartite-type tricarboxylate transporter receptor subunit TctC
MTLEEIVGDPGFTLSEFQWIGRTALSTNAFIVHPDMPWDSVTDIDREVTFGSIGPDASATVTWEITVQELGLPETNYVHGLSGLGEVLTSVIRGDVEAGIVVPSSPQVVEAASAGDIKVLLTYTVDPLSGYEQAENLSDIDRRDLTATAGTQRAFTGPPDLPENIRQFLENSLVGLKDNEDMLAWVAENGYEQNFSPVGKDAVLEWNASAKKLYSEYTDMFAD